MTEYSDAMVDHLFRASIEIGYASLEALVMAEGQNPHEHARLLAEMIGRCRLILDQALDIVLEDNKAPADKAPADKALTAPEN